MNFEIIVEDRSGEKMLGYLMEKILKGYGNNHFKITVAATLKNRLLMNSKRSLLPKEHKPFLLEVIEKQILVIDATLGKDEVIVVEIDSDGESPVKLRQKLQTIINKCKNNPLSVIGLAIEEGEAWFLGDAAAIRKAFPSVKDSDLQKYTTSPKENGTWEILADAIYPGGAIALKKLGYPLIGKEKSNWAVKIAPNMNVDSNQSPSFCEFRDSIRTKVTS